MLAGVEADTGRIAVHVDRVAMDVGTDSGQIRNKIRVEVIDMAVSIRQSETVFLQFGFDSIRDPYPGVGKAKNQRAVALPYLYQLHRTPPK